MQESDPEIERLLLDGHECYDERGESIPRGLGATGDKKAVSENL
jgi:hypothetical protein